jgi:prepilin-type N-terminal cleavage/methylation domain-containing protein
MLARLSRPEALRCARRGMTLVEMLVAVAITLILLFAILNLAKLIGDSSTTGRAILELSGELRSVAIRLQSDLDRATCKSLAWINSGAGPGYFEYAEGPVRDGGGSNDSLLGDYDDGAFFTIHSTGEPFSGRGPSGTVYSEDAEVMWWITQEADGTRRLRRRLLLVIPTANLGGIADINTALASYDISVSVRPGGMGNQVVPNSMADLSRREYRTPHQPAGAFPFNGYGTAALAMQGTMQGEDIVLGNCQGFDVRAYDPFAPIGVGAASALMPGDPGYVFATANGNNLGRGAYVDLNFGGAAGTWFSGPPATKSYLNMAVYDTWSSHYENDGLDQDGVGGADQGTDGLDNDGNNGVDDVLERETSPPYPYPLRGIRVTIRAYEPSSRQVRQASVVGDFTPH